MTETFTSKPRRVTEKAFALAVGCHPSTAARIRNGERMPGRELFQKIVDAYDLDPVESFRYFCGPRKEFGEYIQREVFRVTKEDIERDRELSSIRYNK